MLRNTQCYQSDPRDMGQWIAPKKEVILLQCKAGWAHMCWPSSLPSEELQHLDMGTWLPGRGWEGLTSTWSSLCRFSSKAILKEDYMDQLLMNACRQLSSWDGFGVLVMWHQELDWPHFQEWNGGWRSWDSTAVAFFWLVAKLQCNNTVPNSTISKLFLSPSSSIEATQWMALDRWDCGQFSSRKFNKPHSICWALALISWIRD